MLRTSACRLLVAHAAGGIRIRAGILCCAIDLPFWTDEPGGGREEFEKGVEGREEEKVFLGVSMFVCL